LNPFKENKVLRFLGSVQVALPMILILAVLLATGTIVESRYSTPVAKRFVYGTWWFAGFMVLLAVNLFCSAMSRFPWKKYQTGFVVTHLGIIIVLAGALVTQQWGADGQIALKEGESGHVFQEEKPTLYYQIGSEGEIGQVPASFPFRQPDPDHPLILHLPNDETLMVDQFYLNAQKKVRGRAAQEGEKGFTAVHIDLKSSFVHENQWLFLGNPQSDHLDLGPASVYFEKEADWKKRSIRDAKTLPPNLLAVMMAADGTLKYQTRHRGEFTPVATLKVGEGYSTGWMDMEFKAEERMENAVPDPRFEQEPLPSQKDPEPAIHYQVARYSSGEKKEGWLGFQEQANFTLGGQTFALAYGPRRVDLPFALQLNKFKIGFDPGTEKAASYSSDIYYQDPEKGTQAPAVISMNEPLHYRGYTVYQASYEAEPDGSYISVFSVGRDPGMWPKYIGALVLVAGIIFMFWFKNPNWGRKEENAQ